MLIKNLPKPIKGLVFKRQIEQGNEPNEEMMLSNVQSQGNFNFAETPECGEFWREINKSNYKPFFEKYGGVILCTSPEQGAKIIEYFKSLGIDTGNSRGTLIGNYYGIYKNRFTTTSLEFCFENSVPIFTLDELGVQTSQEQPELPELPEINFDGIEMEVSVNGVSWVKSKVLAKINNLYLTKNLSSWKHARPIQQKVKVTKEQIAEAFNTTVELLEIE